MASPIATAATSFWKARVLKGEPKGDRGGSHGDQDRNRDPERVVIDMRAHPHSRHAGVVHGDDAEADEASAEEEDFRCRLFATDGVKPDAGDERRSSRPSQAC